MGIGRNISLGKGQHVEKGRPPRAEFGKCLGMFCD